MDIKRIILDAKDVRIKMFNFRDLKNFSPR